MAKTILVYHADGKPDFKVKKSAALALVHQLLAVWVIQGVSIRRLAIRQLSPEAMRQRFPIYPSAYVPEILPPSEVHGLIFTEPLINRGEQEQSHEGLRTSRLLLLKMAREWCANG